MNDANLIIIMALVMMAIHGYAVAGDYNFNDHEMASSYSSSKNSPRSGSK